MKYLEVLELFAETAPTVYDAGSLQLWRSSDPDTKRARDAAWKAANPLRVKEHRAREYAKRKEKKLALKAAKESAK